MEDRIVLINNNEYGAAELQRTYQRSFREGLIIAVLLHIVAIAVYICVMYVNPSKADEKKLDHKDLIFVDLDKLTPPPPIDENDQIKPKVEDIVKPVKDMASLEPDPVAKEKSDKVLIKTQDELNNIQENVTDHGDTNKYAVNDNTNLMLDDRQVINKFTKDKDITVKDKDTYNDFEVEVAPECTNCQQVKSSIVYPQLAIEGQIEGKVNVKLLVGTDGSIKQIGKISGNEVFYDEVRQKSMNLKFTPGLQNNKAVNVWVVVPFSFKLKN